MEKDYSIEEKVVIIVKDFMEDIKTKEPFNFQLMDYRLRLKSKLMELLTQLISDRQFATVSFNSALEGMERYLEDRINRIDLECEEELRRTIRALEETNEVLKEFLYRDEVKDKGVLSRVSGRIGQWVSTLDLELKRRFGGILRKIKKLLRS